MKGGCVLTQSSLFFFPSLPSRSAFYLNFFLSLAKESTFTRGSLRSLDWKRQSVSENLEAFSWIPYVFFGTVAAVCLAVAEAGYINPMEHRESLDPLLQAFYLGTRELEARQTPVIVWSVLLNCPIISQNRPWSQDQRDPQSIAMFCFVTFLIRFHLIASQFFPHKIAEHKGYYVFWVNVLFSWTVVVVSWDVHVLTALVLAF